MSMETGATIPPPQRGRSQSQMVVVEIGEPQSPESVSRLSKGKGKLFKDVERIVNDLIKDGTVKSNAQPVVIVVREHAFAFLRSLWTRD
jgi:hypothetical protein